jgi:thioredoxin-related protein
VRAAYKPRYHFVSAYVRNGSGAEVAKKYNVRGFPNIIFFDARGRILCRSYGAFNHGDDALALDSYVQKLNSDPQMRAALNPRKACGRLDPTLPHDADEQNVQDRPRPNNG